MQDPIPRRLGRITTHEAISPVWNDAPIAGFGVKANRPPLGLVCLPGDIRPVQFT